MTTIDDLETPALLVDLDRLERNLDRMAARVRAGGKDLRPHVKTHKCPEIARMQIERGAIGVTVAKLGEAEVMADAGIADLFVANQIVGADKIRRLAALAERCRMSVGADDAGVVSAMAAGLPGGVEVGVRIEVDTGLHRAGVRTVQDAVELARITAGLRGVRLEGVFTHEGHVYAVGPEDARAVCAEAAERMRATARAMRASGLPSDVVSMGSTPGAAAVADEPGITEMRPGVYVFLDATQVELGASVDDCALTVLATVTSRPDPHTAILDAGTKALAADRGEAGARCGFLADVPGAILDWASEEHGHVSLAGDDGSVPIGRRVRVVPRHACGCVNMHREMYAIRGETVESVWPVAASGRFR